MCSVPGRALYSAAMKAHFVWEAHRETGYQWWITRLWYCSELYDVVRIDHFRGFDEYFSIPYGSKTAAEGHWEKGPGIELFRAVEQALAAEKDPADQEAPKRDLPADHPLRAEELGVTAEESCSCAFFSPGKGSRQPENIVNGLSAPKAKCPPFCGKTAEGRVFL